jgi:hypothetical protein
MSANETGWVVETKPVASTVIPTPEALVAREREARRPNRGQGEKPILRRLSPRRSYGPDVVAYDERARELGRRAVALNEEIAAREEALVRAREADHEALTAWQLGDGKALRPEPTVPALEREIEAMKADRSAAVAAAERVYEDKERTSRSTDAGLSARPTRRRERHVSATSGRSRRPSRRGQTSLPLARLRSGRPSSPASS